MFDATGTDTILVHACNCEGKWGSGIAVDFKKKFPRAHAAYKELCKEHGKQLVGSASIYVGGSDIVAHQRIGMLYNSVGYSAKRDSEKKILKNTILSVTSLLYQLPAGIKVHSPLLNAGKFGVPWEKTEFIIETLLEKANPQNISWTVWKLK